MNNTNNTQIGDIPSETLFESNNNNNNDSNIDQLLPNEIVTNSQQSLVQFNTTTNMIPSQIPCRPNRIQLISSHVLQVENLTRRQLGRRRRRQRQRQRRQQRRQEQRQQQERPPPQQQQQQQQREIRYPRYRRWSSIDRERDYYETAGFEDYMEENISPALEEYYWERMNPNERREAWEQNHLNELQRNATALEQQQQDLLDSLEGFAILEQLALIQDELEQIRQIDAIEKIQEEEIQQRNNAEQIQLQQWEEDPLERYAIEEELKLIQDEM